MLVLLRFRRLLRFRVLRFAIPLRVVKGWVLLSRQCDAVMDSICTEEEKTSAARGKLGSSLQLEGTGKSFARTLSAKLRPVVGEKRLTMAMLTELSLRSPQLIHDYLFDPLVWSEAFHAAKSRAERGRLRALILEGTLQASREEHYRVWPCSKAVALPIPTRDLDCPALVDCSCELDAVQTLRQAKYPSTAHFLYGTPPLTSQILKSHALLAKPM